MNVAPHEPVFQPDPAAPTQQPAGNRSLGVQLLACLTVATVIAGLGAPLGLLWSAVAPKVELMQTEYGPYPVDGQPEGYVADEGWFMGIAVAAGIVFAALVWLVLRRFRGPLMLTALVAGCIGGAVLAAWLGHQIGLAEYERLIREAAPGTKILRPVRLRTADVGLWHGLLPRARGAVLIQALVAAALYTALAGFHHSSSLRPGEDDDEPQHSTGVSWGWPAPQDRTAAPAPHGLLPEGPPPGAAEPARPVTD